MANKFMHVSLDDVMIMRLNYPYNCYSLDITNNNDIKEKGVKQLFLDFNIIEKVSVEILLEGHSLTSFRPIKAHRFHSSGADITLDDLGEKTKGTQ